MGIYRTIVMDKTGQIVSYDDTKAVSEAAVLDNINKVPANTYKVIELFPDDTVVIDTSKPLGEVYQET